MITIAGFIYVLYFLLLGGGLRILYNLISNKPWALDSMTELTAHAFFQGVFLHILIFNTLQLFNCPNSWLLVITGIIVMVMTLLLLWRLNKLHFIPSLKVINFQHWIIPVIVTTASIFIYWNGILLPNIAWDSWIVWEGKADQWVIYGLQTDTVLWEDWVQDTNAVFNQAANYPDGLSLIYFLPKLIAENQGFAITKVMHLFAFGMMTLLLVKRASKDCASIYLQAIMAVVLYTTPLISNHLMIQGYADIWLGMYILLILLSLMDFKEVNNPGRGFTLFCYLSILPMLKLEGWVWLVLFALAFLLNRMWHSKYTHWWIGGLVMCLAIMASGLINLNLPMGDLIINHQRLTVFNLIDTPIQFVNITDELLASFLWQNNWSILWLGLPFLLISFFTQSSKKSNQMAQVFFVTALMCFLFLFYLTEASDWAIDFTAINRLVLQLTPCYIYLLFKMLAQLEKFKPQNKKTSHKKTQATEHSPIDENTTT